MRFVNPAPMDCANHRQLHCMNTPVSGVEDLLDIIVERPAQHVVRSIDEKTNAKALSVDRLGPKINVRIVL
jgi:hypothetical protein